MASTQAGREGSKLGKAPATGKPRELEDSLNFYIYHRLSRRLARALVPTPVSPNMVSVAGGLLVVLAGVAYTELSWPVSVLLGFLLHALWHVVDGADGDLARLTGKASPIGELVDGVCDYASHLALYGILAAFLDDHIGWWAWPIATFAGLCRIVQANHAESQRRIYLWRVYGVPWLKEAPPEGEPLPQKGLFTRIFGPFGRAYVALAAATSPSAGSIDEAFKTVGTPEERDGLRQLCREESQPNLPLQIVLGANQRTVLLGLCMAAGSPLYYFIAEITLFNLLLAVSIRRQNRCNRRLAAIIDAAGR